MSDTVLHISSAIIHARPEQAEHVRAAILRTMPEVEIPAVEGGKLIATLETTTEAEIVTRLDAITLMDGVLSVSLIYHHFEPLSGLGLAVPDPEAEATEGGTAS